MSRLEMEELTATQTKVLHVLQRFLDLKGYPPTVEEFAKQIGVTKATVHKALERLTEKGYLKRTQGKARGIELLRPAKVNTLDMVAVPILGEVSAGVPISPQESSGGFAYIPASIVGKHRCFALHITGESMRDAGIQNGDLIVCRQQPVAEHGAIVVASIDGEVTCKRLAIERDRIRLIAENPEFKPIDVEPEMDFRILGKMLVTRRVVGTH